MTDAVSEAAEVADRPRSSAGRDGALAPPRLLSVRLQGFKSFAERTLVEFGAGISAIVGPNGSGKSNLADALRWALGEQGRSLRTRKSEDVIFAGSEKRAALGMADVTLVLDNADGLLPVDFSVVELGRRLYRSGENEYLLNRQRVRLRDLVDLLDAAHLAENAFLFIGQGMVDQALALRPEERRPLFEEVAGVRRPERRRRKAEEQLAESEANLARIEDILAELRPQARRLAAQAEQQATRASAAEELAGALVAAAHARWHEAAGRVASTATARDTASRDADRAMGDLTAAEDAASTLASELSSAVAAEAERRERHEGERSVLTELRLRQAALDAEVAALERERGRAEDERAVAETSLEGHRRMLAASVPERDHDAEAALAEADRALADALAELASLRSADRARGEKLAAVRRAEAAREAEAETARRRLAESERRLTDETAQASAAAEKRAGLDRAAGTAREHVIATADALATATKGAEAARAELAAAEARRRIAAEEAGRIGAQLSEGRGRLDALTARLRDEEARGIARSARRRGGRRLDEDLVVDPALRPAVEAALADAVRAYVVDPSVIGDLAAERGLLVPNDGSAGQAVDHGRREQRFLDAVGRHGGGRLATAVSRDPAGAAARLLARTVWLPDLAACLAVRSELPPGWLAVTRDGSAVIGDRVVRFGSPDGVLERRADLGRLEAEVERLAGRADEAHRIVQLAETEVARAAALAESTRGDRDAAETAHRRAVEDERQAARGLEAVVREAAWHEAQRDRLAAEVGRLRDAFTGPPTPSESVSGGEKQRDDDAIAAWEGRVADLRVRRDRLAGEHAEIDATRRRAEARRAAAAAGQELDEQRLAAVEHTLAELHEREAERRTERESLAGELAAASAAEETARAALDEVRLADAATRQRLTAAETEAHHARERLRSADERLRAAERSELEARLGLDALREQLLVELAGLGELGLRALGAPVGDVAEAAETDDAAAFEAGLEAVAPAWAAQPATIEPPSPGRLASLRRRFHELGAVNPFAVEEYQEVRTRLEGMEAQEADLRTAIARTRELIEDLNRMIAEQFRTTFAALETAFDRRFTQLFGGGFARLSLTDPDDLAATGVEIVARPPGKKAQALAMLSGGERALTAVALLFGMLEVRPVPFCVLDEVDAALDEANIGRFTAALRELASGTQFVVITHNRGTIEEADALYGVTVGDDSVSRMISLRLDEAQAIAERRAPRAVSAG